MITLAFDPGLSASSEVQPLTWNYWLWGPRQVRTAITSCIRGHLATLAPDTHDISERGLVTPSYVCPFNCDFHEFIKLEAWNA